MRIEAFILAGGASTRMGGDKARLRLGGKTFVERAAAALREIEPQNLSVVGWRGEDFLNLRILPDVSAAGEKRGSIVGLHTALSGAKTDWAALLACDLPFASGALFRRLIRLAQSSENECAAVVPLQPDGKMQPLCALYKPNLCLPEIEKMRAEGIWRLSEFVRRIDARLIEFSAIADLPNAEKFFFNVNTPADYERAVEMEKNLAPGGY